MEIHIRKSCIFAIGIAIVLSQNRLVLKFLEKNKCYDSMKTVDILILINKGRKILKGFNDYELESVYIGGVEHRISRI